MSSATAREGRLVWIDLEMTGLDPARDVILEIAALVTEPDLAVVAELSGLVVRPPPEALRGMSDVVRQMHEKNGLLRRVEAATLTVAAAEEEVLRFLRPLCVAGNAPLCGNTIWMDRMFPNRQMPELDRFLYYRTVDVSSFKELARRWSPEIAASAPAKPDTHRALDDVRASLEELRHYRRQWLKLSDSPR